MDLILRTIAILTLFLISIPNVLSANNCNSIELPITFSEFGLPHIPININEKEYSVLFDLGSSFGIHLPSYLSSEIEDLAYTGKSIHSVNIVGNTSKNKEFFISELFLKCMEFKNITGVELSPWVVSFGKESSVQAKENIIVIGRGLFINKAIIIDYSKNKLTILNKESSSKYFTGESFPFVIESEGITIPLASKHGSYMMSLDSGSSISLIVSSKIHRNEIIQTCNIDFGQNIQCQQVKNQLLIGGKINYKSNVYLYPINPRFNMDGLLGGDFFKAFIVKLDFLNNEMSLLSK